MGGFPFYAVTVNFSPQIALAMVPDLPTLRNKEARLNCLTLPPAGASEPPPMDKDHPKSLFQCLFLNNYGKHNPNISGRVTDFLWDWQGMLQTFNFFVFIIEVHGNKIMRV